MDYQAVARQLLEVVGGASNIRNYEHCATRLRLVLKDNNVVDPDQAEALEGLQGYFFSTGQHQFVFGTGKVNEVYAALGQLMEAEGVTQISESSAKEDAYDQLNPVQKFVRILADILVPLIPVLVTTGLLMGIRGLLNELGVSLSGEWNELFAVLTDTAFAFLPVFITYSATKKFGGNPIIGIALGLMLVAPQLPNAYGVASGEVEAFHLLGVNVTGYQGTIFPAIIAGWLLSKLEEKIRKFVPQAMDLIVTPFLTIVFTLVLMLFGLGPIIQLVEGAVIGSIVKVIQAPFGIGYALFGGLQQLLVVTGLHHSLSIIEISLLNDTGRNILNPLMSASMAGQFGAAIATASLMRQKVERSNMISAATPTVFGITEPLLFGVNLRSLRVLGSGVVGGAVAGLMAYFLNLSATGMGITFLPGLLLYTDQVASVVKYLSVIATAFVVAFLCVRAQAKAIRQELEPEAEVEETVVETPSEDSVRTSIDVQLIQPMAGDIMELDQVPDPVFASGAMGAGCGILPTDGRVLAPFNGEIMLVADTKHAIGLRSNEGVEVLIHVGLDTVELEGKPFTSYVQVGDKVQQGQLLLEADLPAIEAASKSTITPIIITNSAEFDEVATASAKDSFIHIR